MRREPSVYNCTVLAAVTKGKGKGGRERERGKKFGSEIKRDRGAGRERKKEDEGERCDLTRKTVSDIKFEWF